MENFAFSVIMAVYNTESFLEEAVESLIHQTYGFEKIQLILVDDGSTDGSFAVCQAYAQSWRCISPTADSPPPATWA